MIAHPRHDLNGWQSHRSYRSLHLSLHAVVSLGLFIFELSYKELRVTTCLSYMHMYTEHG